MNESVVATVEEAAIVRLREKRAALKKHKQAEALAAGKAWALAESTEYDELERVAPLEFGYDADAFGELCEAYMDDGRPNASDREMVAERLFGMSRGEPSNAEVVAFVEGAAEVFNRI